MTRGRFLAATVLAAGLGTGRAAAQQPAPAPAPVPPPPAATPLAVGVEAPDFTLPSSTKDGLSAKPLHLKDLRGKTVVIAFFYKSRTKG